MQYILSELELQKLQDKAESYDDIENYMVHTSGKDYSSSDVSRIMEYVESKLLRR